MPAHKRYPKTCPWGLMFGQQCPLWCLHCLPNFHGAFPVCFGYWQDMLLTILFSEITSWRGAWTQGRGGKNMLLWSNIEWGGSPNIASQPSNLVGHNSFGLLILRWFQFHCILLAKITIIHACPRKITKNMTMGTNVWTAESPIMPSLFANLAWDLSC